MAPIFVVMEPIFVVLALAVKPAILVGKEVKLGIATGIDLPLM